ncbi:hypothetical protein [Hymenobacter busanensis]|uniref:hypothetical protein n=1 Tax=Hymenobacter busanensis TaxID=2607656 RepID=UPI001423D471|nr:hypothetical protein [Hymenobacter busanensis]
MLFRFLPFETTCTYLVRGFDLVRNILFGVVGPFAVWLHVALREENKHESPARGILLLLTLAWLLVLLIVLPLSFFFEDAVPWQTKRVLYRSEENPSIRITEQTYNLFVTTSTTYRVVKLTPVLGLWQLVQPVDTARFNPNGWQRVSP